MLYVPAYTHERRPYSDTCIRLALTLTLSRPSRFVPSARLMIGASSRAPCFVWDVPCDYMFRDERGGRLTGQPMGPQVDTETIRTVLSTNRVDSRSFSSRCWAFRCTHSSTDPIRLPCIRLVFHPGPYGLWRVFRVTLCFGTRGEEDLLGNRWAHR